METDYTFSVNRDSLWMKTLDDGVLYFKNAQPSIIEKSQDELKKPAGKDDSKYELSQENCIRILSKWLAIDIEQSKLYWYSLNSKIYKAIEVKKDWDNKPVLVRLAEHDSAEELVLDDQTNIGSLKDSIKVLIRIYSINNVKIFRKNYSIIIMFIYVLFIIIKCIGW